MVADARPDVEIPEAYFDLVRLGRVTKGKRLVATLRTVTIACCVLLPLLIVVSSVVGLYNVDIVGKLTRADPKVRTAHAPPPAPQPRRGAHPSPTLPPPPLTASLDPSITTDIATTTTGRRRCVIRSPLRHRRLFRTI